MFVKMLQTSFVYYLLLRFGLTAVVAQQPACHPDVRAIDGGAHCLSLIRQKALDTSSAFSTVCLPEVSDMDGCSAESHFPNEPNSLSMLVFGTRTDRSAGPLSGLDRYLNVIYTSPPGNYTACDYKYESHDVAEFELDPLSDASVEAWVMRQIPKLSWRAGRNELFTLILLNLDRNIIHLGLANIRGNGIENASVLYPYHGSNARWVDPVVFGFFLYKQWGPIVSKRLPLSFNLTSFVCRHGLEGPVGIIWMVTDAYAYSNAIHQRQYCPFLIQRELEKKNPDLPFLAQPYNLKVHLRVRFTTDELTYKCGPLSITHRGNDLFLDPIGNPIIYVFAVRSGSTITVSMEMYKQFPNNEVDFAGKLYSMIIIDEDYPEIHGFTMNIPGDDVASGAVIIPYGEPSPFSVHTYYFLLYEQKAEISLPATAAFTQTTCPNNRCLNGVVQAFVSVNELELVGATWMRADNDDYVQCMRKM